MNFFLKVPAKTQRSGFGGERRRSGVSDTCRWRQGERCAACAEVWLGWLDSNQRMRESKSRALPLGYTPLSEIKSARAGAALRPLRLFWGGRWDSNPRHSEPQSDALPTELRPPYQLFRENGTPGGTRTPGPLLRRQLLYPPELQAHMERVMGIEPTRPAWKAGILPLNYTRMDGAFLSHQPQQDTIY